MLLRVVFEETFRFSLSIYVVRLGRAYPAVGFSNESRLARFLSFERVAAPVVAGERLGVGHQLPAVVSQFVHDASKRDVRPGPRPEDDLPLIQPQFLDFSRPAFAAWDKAQLRVLPLHGRSTGTRDGIFSLSADP